MLPFEPFTLSCSTCGSQLRVNNPALVGTIANCPKCGSMVQIPAPDELAPGEVDGASEPRGFALGSDSVDSDTMTRDAVPEPPDSAGASEMPSGFAPSESDDRADEVAAPPGGDVIPPAWQSAQTERARHIALIVSLSAGGLIVAALLFGWFVHVYQQRADERQSLAATEVDADESLADDDLLPPDELPAELATDALQPESSDKVETTAAGESVSDDEPPEGTSSSRGDDAIDEDTSRPDLLKPPIDDPPGGAKRTENESTEKLTAADRDGAEVSDLFPKSALAGLTPPKRQGISRDGEADEDPGSGLVDLPPGLKQFMPFTGFGEKPVDSTPQLEAPPSIDRIELEDAAEEVVDPMLAAEGPRTVDLEQALMMEMGFYADGGYPLSDFALIVGQLTGAPVELDWLSFDLAGTDVRSRIPVSQQMLPAAVQLDRAAAAVDGNVRLVNSIATISVTDQHFDTLLAELLALDDFGDGEASARKLLASFLDVETDADENFLIEAERTEQQLAAVAGEALRRMRGLTGKVADNSLSRWATPASATQPWKVVEGGDAGPQHDTAVTVAQLLRQVARRNGATLLINWDDALRRQLTPETLVLPYAGDDAGSMLRRVLEPYQLQVREVAPGYWWMGTEATYDRLPVVVWTEALGDQRDGFLRRLGTVMGDAGSNVYRVSYDADSDRVLLLIPRYILRQLDEIAEA